MSTPAVHHLVTEGLESTELGAFVSDDEYIRQISARFMLQGQIQVAETTLQAAAVTPDEESTAGIAALRLMLPELEARLGVRVSMA